MMRDDDNPPDLRPPVPGLPRGTLPPQAKILKEVFTGLERIGKEIGLPVLCLLAVKWGLLDPKEGGIIFAGSVAHVLGGNFALRRGEHAKDDR